MDKEIDNDYYERKTRMCVEKLELLIIEIKGTGKIRRRYKIWELAEYIYSMMAELMNAYR